MQAVFQDVYKLLNQTCDQFLQGSNSLADALHLVTSYLTPNKVQKDTSHHLVYNNVSPYVDPASNAVCTTPPPDEPSAMEITASQSVIIEINDTIMNNLNKGQCKMIIQYSWPAVHAVQCMQMALAIILHCIVDETCFFFGYCLSRTEQVLFTLSLSQKAL